MAINTKSEVRKYTPDHIQNQSFDENYQVSVAELLAEDQSTTPNRLLRLQTDADGNLKVNTSDPTDVDITTHTNYAKKYYTNAGAVTDGVIWSPAAGKRWHVVSLYIQVSADATVTVEDDLGAGDSPILKGEYKAGSGVVLTYPPTYPLASGEDAADLLITTSAGNVYVTCVGYEV